MTSSIGKFSRRIFSASLVSGAFLAREGHSQTWPGNNPVSLVIPYSAGGGTDILGRVVADKLSKDTGGNVVLLHKPGAVTSIAARYVAKAPPDGQTILLGSVVTFCMAPWSLKTPGFDTDKDFEHITMIAESMYLLVVNSKWSNLEKLVDEAKKRPGELSFASWGIGSTAHLFMLDLMARTGINLIHVPYGGSQPALTDVIGGRIDIMMCPQATAAQHVLSGRLTGLAVLNNSRGASMPKIPTIEEIGLRGLRSPGWLSLQVPSGTPSSIVQTIGELAKTAFKNPATRLMLERSGMGDVEFGSENLKNRIKADSIFYRELMARAGVVPE